MSNIVGSGRDVVAQHRNGTAMRVYLMVERVDRTSTADDFLFVGTMVAIKESGMLDADRSQVCSVLPHTTPLHYTYTQPVHRNHGAISDFLPFWESPWLAVMKWAPRVGSPPPPLAGLESPPQF